MLAFFGDYLYIDTPKTKASVYYIFSNSQYLRSSLKIMDIVAIRPRKPVISRGNSSFHGWMPGVSCSFVPNGRLVCMPPCCNSRLRLGGKVCVAIWPKW